MKRPFAVSVVVLLFAVSFAVAGNVRTADEPVPGQYIVVLSNPSLDVRAAAAGLAGQHGGLVDYIYESAIRGFSVRMSAAGAEALSHNPHVAWVEEDGVVRAIATQSNATWGLDRIDQRSLPLNSTYTYDQTGAGVNVYVVDTGIRFSHAQFGGRAVSGYDAVDGGTADDCNGHGTHVAGTVGGSTYGVAKAARLIGVRVLDCQGSGTTSGVIAGVDWVTQNHVKPAVANMSLGGGASSTLDSAVSNSIAAGVTYAIAAGNGDFLGRQLDACTQSPARVAAAITIGATDSSDRKTSWSNYGNCVDFFAPGASITSSWYTGDTATNTISGTSMATPHVAGAAALYLETAPGSSPQTVRDALYNATTKGIVTSSSTTNNHLLYTLAFSGGGGGSNAAPSANFTWSATGLTAAFTDTSSDSDGSIVSWSWSFGDATSSAAQHPTHTYASAATYSVTLTVTDDGGATASKTQNVTVSQPQGGFTLAARGYKVKGAHRVDLTWSGAASTNVDVFRNGAKVATTANDGAYTDVIGAKGGGSYTYRVCESGTATCSNEVNVSF